MTLILISAYFVINAFMSGYFYKSSEFEGKVYALKVAGVFLIVGIPALFVVIIEDVWDKLESYVPIKFLVSFLFTKRYTKMPLRHLVLVNEKAKGHFSNKWTKWVYLLSLRMVNRRNNYTPF